MQTCVLFLVPVTVPSNSGRPHREEHGTKEQSVGGGSVQLSNASTCMDEQLVTSFSVPVPRQQRHKRIRGRKANQPKKGGSLTTQREQENRNEPGWHCISMVIKAFSPRRTFREAKTGLFNELTNWRLGGVRHGERRREGSKGHKRPACKAKAKHAKKMW